MRTAFPVLLAAFVFMTQPAVAQIDIALSERAEVQFANGEQVRVIVEMAEVAADGVLSQNQIRHSFLNTTFGRDGAVPGFGHLLRESATQTQFVAEVSRTGLESLRNHPLIEAVYEDTPHIIATEELGHNVGTAPLRAEGFDGSGLVIALLDTGVDLNHPFYSERLIEGACFSTPSTNSESLCPNGEATMTGGNAGQACENITGCEHGTASAGIMVGSNSELQGVAPGARLIPVQVFTRVTDAEICGSIEPCLRAWTSDILAAIDWLDDTDDDSFAAIRSVLINTSPFYDATYDATLILHADATRNLQRASFFMPAGNDGTVRRFWTDLSFTAEPLPLYVVQALDEAGEIAAFSNNMIAALDQGMRDTAHPSFAAPGVNISTSLPGGTMGRVTGTSAAAAQVAAANALLLAATNDHVRTMWGTVFGQDRVANTLSNTTISIYDAGKAFDWFDRNIFGVWQLADSANDNGNPFLFTFINFYLGGDRMIFEGPTGGPFEFRNGDLQPTASLIIENRGDLEVTAEPSVAWLTANIRENQSSHNTEYILDMSPNEMAENLQHGVYHGRVRVELGGERYANGVITLIINGDGAAGFENSPWLMGRNDDGFQAALPDAGRQWWRWTAPETGFYLARINMTARGSRPEGVGSQIGFDVLRGREEAALQPVETSLRCLAGHEYRGLYALAPWTERFYAEAGEQYNFAYAALPHGTRAFITPSLNRHTDDPDHAELIQGSDSRTLIAFQTTDTLCITSPRNQEAFFNGPDRAWFRFRPDQTGRHAIWMTTNNYAGNPRDNPPFGQVSIYAGERETLLATYNAAQDYPAEGLTAAFADLDAEETYWILTESVIDSGASLHTHGPETARAPANDDFANATLLNQRNYILTASNRYATQEVFAADQAGLGKSLWWRLVPDIEGQLDLEFLSTFAGTVELFTGETEAALERVDVSAPFLSRASSNPPRIYSPVLAGETYYLRVDSTSFANGFFDLSLRYGERPENDDFSQATPIGLDEVIPGTTMFATFEPGEEIVPGLHDFLADPAERGVWYRFTAPSTGRFQFIAGSYEINPQVAIYQGEQVDALSLLTHGFELVISAGHPPRTIVGFEATQGEVYHVRVSGYALEMGAIEVRVTPGAPANDSSNSPIIHRLGSTVLSDVTSNLYATSTALEDTSINGIELTGSLWYRIEGQGPWAVDTSGSDIDTIIVRGCCRGLTEYNDNAGTDVVTSRLEGDRGLANLLSPDYIMVAGANGARGMIRVNIGPRDLVRPAIVGALLPYARSARVGQPVTTFVTVLNAGSSTARECGIALADPALPLILEFFPTNAATNTVSGAGGETQLVEAWRAVTYLLSLTPTAPLPAQDIELTYSCDGGNTEAQSISGVNTFFVSASTDPTPDILGIAATVGNVGTVNLNTSNRRGFFSTAAMNIGDADSITFSADTGTAHLPLTLTVCETDLAQGGACIGPRSESVTVNMNENDIRTFAIFVAATGDIAFVPRSNRIFARWRDSDGIVRGATSVAVQTQ